MATKSQRRDAMPSSENADTQQSAPPDAKAAQNVWLAGLGALANAQAEGSKAFEALVKQGLEMQTKAQELARERMSAMADPTSTGSWNRLGGIFENRVARALASMGMPSAQDIAALQARVEALEQALAHKTNKPTPVKPRRAGQRQAGG